MCILKYLLILGSCTWQTFSSLAVCSKCVNITSHVKKTCDTNGCYEISLPDGPALYGFGGQINSTITNVSPGLNDFEASVVQFSSLISKRMNDSDDAVAWECALAYCVNTYSASVTDGQLHQKITQSWQNNSASLSQGSDLIYHPPESVIDITPNASTFRVDSLAAMAMNTFMSETFSGSGRINKSGSGSKFSSDVIHALYDTRNYSKRIGNLAMSMTNNIRQQNDSGSNPLSGTALETETYVKVRWAWFSYPAALIVLSLVYLLGTIIETTHRDILIWKSSNLAMLFHGRSLEMNKSDRGPVNALSQLSERAKDINVELVQIDEEDWKLRQR